MKQRWIAVTACGVLLAACESGEPIVGPSSASSGGAEADNPAPPSDIFSQIGGWIVYGHLDERGIWAVDPTTPGDPDHQLLVSHREGEPLGWSRDGSKLLLRREVNDPSHDPVNDLDLFILNADGTETRVTHLRDWISGSISPDGSQVVYAGLEGPIYAVDLKTGERRLVLARQPRSFPDGRWRTWLYNPTFSPDGTQIAYFDGMGDWGHSLRVMNANGSGVRVLVDQPPQGLGHVDDLVWSPDGTRLAFSAEEGGIWIIRVDGSGLTKVIPDGVNPSWSPDGSRISYQPADPNSFARGKLEIADPDGTNVKRFGYAASGPWDPLDPERG
jgi:Tol biopolymer transport system component